MGTARRAFVRAAAAGYGGRVSEPALSTVNAAERIDRDLTRAILRGEHRPGTRLPTLRELAQQYGVNPSTMQRALARLEARGLITARQGSGLRVNDPHDIADLSLIADWLAACADDPERATALIVELGEVRRILAVRLMVRHRERILDVLPSLLAEVAAFEDPDNDASWRAEIEFSKKLVRATGNGIFAVLLSTIAKVLEEHPILVEAMYGDRARVLSSMQATLTALFEGGDDMGARIEAVMVAADAETARRYRLGIERRLAQLDAPHDAAPRSRRLALPADSR